MSRGGVFHCSILSLCCRSFVASILDWTRPPVPKQGGLARAKLCAECVLRAVLISGNDSASEIGAMHKRGGGGVLTVMHGRSRMTIDPRIPTMPGRSTSGFHRTGRHR